LTNMPEDITWLYDMAAAEGRSITELIQSRMGHSPAPLPPTGSKVREDAERAYRLRMLRARELAKMAASGEAGDEAFSVREESRPDWTKLPCPDVPRRSTGLQKLALIPSALSRRVSFGRRMGSPAGAAGGEVGRKAGFGMTGSLKSPSVGGGASFGRMESLGTAPSVGEGDMGCMSPYGGMSGSGRSSASTKCDGSQHSCGLDEDDERPSNDVPRRTYHEALAASQPGKGWVGTPMKMLSSLTSATGRLGRRSPGRADE